MKWSPMPKPPRSPVIGDVELFAREIRADGESRAAPRSLPSPAPTANPPPRRWWAISWPRPDLTPRSAAISAIPCWNWRLLPVRDHLCAGNVQLPDRSHAGPGARYRHAVQSHARSYRPPWHAWRITPPSSSGCCARCPGRAGHRRRGRCIWRGDLHAISGEGATAWPVSVGKVLGRGIFVVDGVLYDAQNGRAARIMELNDAPHLRGAHNWQNAALAFAATKPFVKDGRAIAAAIASFPGPGPSHGRSRPHRQDPVHQ